MQITGFSTVFKTSNSFNAKAWDKGPRNVKAFLPTHTTRNTTCIYLYSMPYICLKCTQKLHTSSIHTSHFPGNPMAIRKFKPSNPPLFFIFLPPKNMSPKLPLYLSHSHPLELGNFPISLQTRNVTPGVRLSEIGFLGIFRCIFPGCVFRKTEIATFVW